MKKPSAKKPVAAKAAKKVVKPAARKKLVASPLTVVGSKESVPSKEQIAAAKALEKIDAAKVPIAKTKTKGPLASSSKPLRNSDFPTTYIKRIDVSLDDPDHWMTLTWTGPKASSQETGPFRTSPGAGVKGINCDVEATSQRSGTKCTPKGTRSVEGFQSALNSDARAVFVTWFMRARGIALHYFPSVPSYAASHGCVRIESKRVAQLIQENARVDLTKVVVDGTWTKPKKQW